jgi:hypothetical protein
MVDYPVTFDITRPEKFERPHVFLRLLVVIILSILAGAIGWLFGLVYLALPVVAAIFISQRGAQGYLEQDAPRVTGWVRWIIALYAYLGILTDRFPTEKPEEIVHFEVKPGGSPTVGSALLRLIYSIPSALVLAILGIASGIVLIIAAIMVLIQENYPDGLYNFQRGILRWEARLLGYHASLVGEYPPFALDTEPLGGAPASTPPPPRPQRARLLHPPRRPPARAPLRRRRRTRPAPPDPYRNGPVSQSQTASTASIAVKPSSQRA